MFKVTFTLQAARLEKLLSAASSAGFSEPSINYAAPTAEALDPTRKRGPYKKSGEDKPVRRRGRDHEILSLTAKKTSAGTKREAVTIALEKLEAEHGIGKVTRKMLREKCTEDKLDHQVIYQLLHEGYLKASSD